MILRRAGIVKIRFFRWMRLKFNSERDPEKAVFFNLLRNWRVENKKTALDPICSCSVCVQSTIHLRSFQPLYVPSFIFFRQASYARAIYRDQIGKGGVISFFEIDEESFSRVLRCASRVTVFSRYKLRSRGMEGGKALQISLQSHCIQNGGEERRFRSWVKGPSFHCLTLLVAPSRVSNLVYSEGWSHPTSEGRLMNRSKF